MEDKKILQGVGTKQILVNISLYIYTNGRGCPLQSPSYLTVNEKTGVIYILSATRILPKHPICNKNSKDGFTLGDFSTVLCIFVFLASWDLALITNI